VKHEVSDTPTIEIYLRKRKEAVAKCSIAYYEKPEDDYLMRRYPSAKIKSKCLTKHWDKVVNPYMIHGKYPNVGYTNGLVDANGILTLPNYLDVPIGCRFHNYNDITRTFAPILTAEDLNNECKSYIYFMTELFISMHTLVKRYETGDSTYITVIPEGKEEDEDNPTYKHSYVYRGTKIPICDAVVGNTIKFRSFMHTSTSLVKAIEFSEFPYTPTGIVYKIYFDSDIPYLPYESKDYESQYREEEVLFPGNLTFTILSEIQNINGVNMVEARISMDEYLKQRYIEERYKLAIKIPNATPSLCDFLNSDKLDDLDDPEKLENCRSEIEKFF